MSPSCRRNLCGIVLSVFALTTAALAQNSSHQGTPAESKTGQSSVSTYTRDKIETVNLANGNLSLSIPLATVGGRGSAGYTIALSYNSKVWTSEHDVEDVSLNGQEDVPPEVPPEGAIRNLYTAVYDKIEAPEPGLAKLGGGWTIRLTPGIKALTFGVNPSTSTNCSTQSEEPPKCGYKYVLTKMWLTLPDGSQVELRDRDTRGTPAIAPLTNGLGQLIDRDRGRVWQSIDGSGVTFVRDTGYTVGQVGGAHFPSGWVFLPDGTRMQMVEGATDKITDRNGNFVNVGFGTYTDQLGRQTLLTFSENTNTVTVTVKGYFNTPDRSMTIHLGVIGNNLRSHFQQLPRPFTTGDAYRDPQGNDFPHMIQQPHTDLFDHSEGIKYYGTDQGDDVGARIAVTSLTLLDGRSLRFRYNQYGEVAEVVYPGGGVSQIDYSGGNSGICQINSQMAATFNRKVSERRTLTDGATVDATWVYSHGGLNLVDGVSYPTTTIEAHKGDATGALLALEKHSFMKLGFGAEYRNCQSGTGTGNEKWENDKEIYTETQTETGTILTKRHWDQRAALVWVNDGPDGYLHTRGQDQSPNDDRVIWEETKLENGKVKRVEYGYDDFNNITSIKEYDFGTAGNPGVLLRETLRTYAGTGPNPAVNGYCYTNLNPLDSSCGSGLATDVSTIIHQRHVLLSETIKDAGENPKASTQVEYDKYGESENPLPSTTNSSMIQYDGVRFAAFNPLTEPRGNVTKVTRWAGGSNYISSFSQYDKAGQVVWSKDPQGHVSKVSYTDNFGNGTNPDSGVSGPAGPTFAMASTATNALLHQVKMQYDYSLGAATGVKDPNGIITKTEYDNLGRPSRAIVAVNLAEQSISEMSYPTETANEARISKQVDASRWLTSKTSFDGFGRAVLASTAEDGLHYSGASYSVFSKTIYDPLGRVKLVTNPYRALGAVTDGWSRSSYDLAGRVTEVATFSGDVATQPPDSGTNSNWTGSVTTVYASEETTVTDQAARKRKSVTDALGRLIKVYEAPNDQSFNHLTSYSYDTLDNLTSVSQGSGQPPRTFVYDSLKRLTSAFNPESGTITYQYDANGNLTQKTDSRPVVTEYGYDALNRNTTVNYSNTTITPDITRIYDTGAYGIGRLRESYAGGNETAGATVEHTKVQVYDALGRPLDQRQRFKTNSVWSTQEYRTRRVYNLAGAVTSQIYPSERTVTYAYDNAGRLNSFNGNLGDGTDRTYASGILYSALGSMTKEQFGTDTAVFNKRAYNSRGQLAEIRASTSPVDTNSNLGAIFNQYSLQCSGAGCNATDNNGNLRKQEVLIPHNDQVSTSWYQLYDYDSLNRLERVKEYNSGNMQLWQQEYQYDRYGNRTIHQTNTWGPTSQPQIPIPKRNFEVQTSTNRLLAPGDLALPENQRRMRYDAAGNLTNDSWSSYGSSAPDTITRKYDAENRMTEALDSSGGTSYYTYNADGQRVRRKIGSAETWQVYGMEGELIAEYAANTATTSPQKEYGYRNGELLITAEPGSGSVVAPVFSDDFNDNALDASKWTQVAPGSPVAVTEQGQRLQVTLAPGTAGYNGVYSTSTYNLTGKTAQVEVAQAVSQAGWCENFLKLELDAQNYFLMDVGGPDLLFRSRVSGINNQTLIAYSAATHRHWRIRHDQSANTINFETSAEGSVWTTHKTVTPGFALTSLRFHLMAGAWGTGNSNPGAAKYDNFQLGQSGAAGAPVTNLAISKPATQVSTYSTAAASRAVDGNTNGSYYNNSVTHTAGGPQEWWQVDLGSSYWLQTVKAWNRTDCCSNRLSNFYVFVSDQPFSSYDLSTTINQAGVTGYYTAGQGGSPTGIAVNRTGRYVRVQLSTPGVLSLAEVEVIGSAVSNQSSINWIVTDQLGTPRMVLDKTGSLANVKRHDYLPFGEELVSQGGRNPALGYPALDASDDKVRQKFTSYERDIETNLDFAQARYYSSPQGRFTSVDPLMASARPGSPQSFNRYSYALNNPLRYVDPTGLNSQDGQKLPPTTGGIIIQNPCVMGNSGCNPVDLGTVTITATTTPIDTTPAMAGTTLALPLPLALAGAAEGSASAGPAGAMVGAYVLSTPSGMMADEMQASMIATMAGLDTSMHDQAQATWMHYALSLGESIGILDPIPNGGQYLVRFGPGPESAESLGAEAANAQAHGFPHGVSTKLVDRISGTDRQNRYAPLSAVQSAFPVQQTGANPRHHTVLLPNPMNLEAASKFNSIFRVRN